MWRMEQSLGSSATAPSASSTMSCVQFVILGHMISFRSQKRTSKDDLQQDVVEQQSAEHTAQLLPLLDVPQRESLVEVVLRSLLQPLHVHTGLQLAPENKMSQFLMDIGF